MTVISLSEIPSPEYTATDFATLSDDELYALIVESMDGFRPLFCFVETDLPTKRPQLIESLERLDAAACLNVAQAALALLSARVRLRSSVSVSPNLLSEVEALVSEVGT